MPTGYDITKMDEDLCDNEGHQPFLERLGFMLDA